MGMGSPYEEPLVIPEYNPKKKKGKQNHKYEDLHIKKKDLKK